MEPLTDSFCPDEVRAASTRYVTSRAELFARDSTRRALAGRGTSPLIITSSSWVVTCQQQGAGRVYQEAVWLGEILGEPAAAWALAWMEGARAVDRAARGTGVRLSEPLELGSRVPRTLFATRELAVEAIAHGITRAWRSVPALAFKDPLLAAALAVGLEGTVSGLELELVVQLGSHSPSVLLDELLGVVRAILS